MNPLDKTRLNIMRIEMEVHAASHIVVDTWRVSDEAISVDTKRGCGSKKSRSSKGHGLVNEDVGHPDHVRHTGVQSHEALLVLLRE